MVYLILSDIHANWEALEAVVAAAQGQYQSVLCCGDVVGYGADPNPVTEWVRQHALQTVRGNHDKFCSGREPIFEVSFLAEQAAVWTRRQLTDANRDWLSALPQGPLDFDGMQLLHGSVRDEDEYIGTVEEVRLVRHLLKANLLFFGHTHNQEIYYCLRSGIRRIPGPKNRETQLSWTVDDKASWLINPGSVGQPRDRDSRAAYALYDTSNRVLSLRRVRYDIAKAQRKILTAGLPEKLAERLSLGC